MVDCLEFPGGRACQDFHVTSEDWSAREFGGDGNVGLYFWGAYRVGVFVEIDDGLC